MTAPTSSGERRIALASSGAREYTAVELDEADQEQQRTTLSESKLAAWVASVEASAAPRWIIRSASDTYAVLLGHGVRIGRSHDLVLCHAILRDTAAVPVPLPSSTAWLRREVEVAAPSLFDGFADGPGEDPMTEMLDQYRSQRRVISSALDGRLTLLCAAESAGGLIAEEMRVAGLPWDEKAHDAILTDTLGTRPVAGGLPSRMVELGDRVRTILGDSALHLDSQPKLLRALHRVGVNVESTGRWELAQHDHPVVEPLLAYKKLSRLLSANGWAWLAEWVHDRRFRPIYIPGGVVTGRWASAGGGALQLPRSLRPAVRADPGWTLIVADVAQLEPRMLAAMAADEEMARAARGSDLYAGVVASGAVSTREEAKYAVLGAMYGATTGDSGRLVPRLRKVYPRAMGLVDAAARTGEDGGIVSTWLGRSSPRPSREWAALQSRATDADADPVEVALARRRARDWGRFTRNFIVQGTAAEWSLIWLAEIRHRLQQLPEAAVPATASGPFARVAHLAFFLHDEVILHVPEEQADAAAEVVREAAAVATTRLFGTFPIDVPLDLRVAASAEK
ncbi:MULTISPECIES: bifunctional 3'-5' exonuclease/DNA polymerase [unclassified Microbacterium]|uniref:bifunctional 3'-5' exonuclease/DNA polymerase n=1 Tax=unclassified Microbacterium TaxID=2609290 RepID=UPI000EA97B03|nr:MULTISPECIES: bifunctional 3'-5' exonuclease/DNA polymerase [unclassified Microbacterium]MBT2486077.1 bifunctional 3'-5' exonuclease/DNA polymerase [Microbacterium sp. ISL-108]RKN68809.1 bifunctional 3'-5' exonuclease/DNA polymerase [Microbacterium sp. CGR2]